MLSPSEETIIRISYREIDSSISRLDAQIKDHQRRRHALCDHRQMLATLLAPVRRLAPELLGEIFRFCLPQDYHEEGAYKAVMLPSHVCKYWRDVALSTPTLWTNIVLRITNKTFESQAALVTTWFSRTGSLSLSFTLDGQENVRPIMAFLLQHCNRWQYINLRVPFETIQPLESAKGYLQHLETIRIDAMDEMDEMSYSVEHIFGSAPRLWELSLNCQLIWNGLSGSWARLAELDVGDASYTVGDCLTLLHSMRNLRKLSIYTDSDIAEHHHSVLSHPLVSFGALGTAAHQLFNHITLPSLRELSLGEIDSEWPRSQLISFLERSSPPFRNFSLGIPEIVDDVWNENMTQILQHIPSLHSLRLVYRQGDVGEGSFLKRLSPQILDGRQVDCLLPKLNTISIHLECQLFAPDYGALKEMVFSRYSLAHNTNAGDNISSPVEQIWKVEVECFYDYGWNKDDVIWHEEVSEILAPLREVVNTVRVVIS